LQRAHSHLHEQIENKTKLEAKINKQNTQIDDEREALQV
jgi:hypothetical protein